MTGIISTNYSPDNCGILAEDRGIAALPFFGRYRLVDFPLSNMVNSGITDLGIIAPTNFRALLDHVGIGKEWALSRKSGGLHILPGSPFGQKNLNGRFLINDILKNKEVIDKLINEYIAISATSKIFNLDYNEVLEYHLNNNADITLIYKENLSRLGPKDYSILTESDKVVSISNSSEDRNNCFLDSLIINKSILRYIVYNCKQDEHLDLLEYLSKNVTDLNIFAYKYVGYVGSFNSVRDYLKTNQQLLDCNIKSEVFNKHRPIITKTQDNPPAKYTSSSNINDSVISTGCIIKGTVDNSIIFRGVIIEENTIVKNSIIFQNSTIGKNSYLDNVVMDKQTNIDDYMSITGDYRDPIVLDKNNKYRKDRIYNVKPNKKRS